MTRHALTKSHRGAVAPGAAAAGAVSFGALAMGAVALGAIAIGAMAVGRRKVGRAQLRRVDIGELNVGRLDVGEISMAGSFSAIARIRTSPGKGDAFERFLREQPAGTGPGPSFIQAHRSRTDPDLFMFRETRADEAGIERQAQAPRVGTLLRTAAEKGLVSASAENPVELELYRAI
jgi:quinol monooxygenase YgiN